MFKSSPIVIISVRLATYKTTVSRALVKYSLDAFTTLFEKKASDLPFVFLGSLPSFTITSDFLLVAVFLAGMTATLKDFGKTKQKTDFNNLLWVKVTEQCCLWKSKTQNYLKRVFIRSNYITITNAAAKLTQMIKHQLNNNEHFVTFCFKSSQIR